MAESTTERTPLLSAQSKASTSFPNNPTPLNLSNLLRALSSLSTGHLPSTAQLSRITSTLLFSSLLQPPDPQGTIWESPYGEGRVGVGKLSREGEKVRLGTRRWLTALEGVVKEGNRSLGEGKKEDRLQEAWWKWARAGLGGVGVEIKHPPSAPPIFSPFPELRNIISLVLTSTEFQSLLSDLIGLLALAVRKKAEGNPLAEEAFERMDQKLAEDGLEGDGLTGLRSEEEAKKVFVERLFAVFAALQQNSQYKQSVLHLLPFFSSVVASPPFSLPTTTLSPSSPLSLIPKIIVAFSHSPDVLNSLFSNIEVLNAEIRLPGQKLGERLIEIQKWLERVLLEEGYILKDGRSVAKADLDDLLSSLPSFTPATPNLLPDILNEASTLFSETIKNPHLAEFALASAFVGEAVEKWMSHLIGVAMGRESVLGDVVEWVAPRLIGMIREWGIPRIEVTLPDVQLALDCPNFLASDLKPDYIGLRNETEVGWWPNASPTSFFDPYPPPAALAPSNATQPNPAPVPKNTYPHTTRPIVPIPPNTTSYASLTRINLTGLRVETKNLGYFIKYKPSFPSWLEYCCCGGFGWDGIGDSGLIDILIGDEETGKGGMDLVIELSTSSDPEQTLAGSLWKVLSTTPTLQTFLIHPHDSTSHPLVLRFLQPILTRLVRTQLETAIRDQVEGWADWIGKFGWQVRKTHDESGGSGSWVWVRAVVATLLTGIVEEAEEEELEDEDDDEETQGGGVEVDVNLKGVTIELGAPDIATSEDHQEGKPVPPSVPNEAEAPSSAPSKDEADESITIGIGAPGVVLPEGTSDTPALVDWKAQAAVVGETLVKGKDEAVKEGKKAVKEAQRGLKEWKIGKEIGRKERGWRSRGFDWQ